MTKKNNNDELINLALRALCDHAHGRELLWWLLSITQCIGHTHYHRNALDTAYSCGKADVGNEIMERLLEVRSDSIALLFMEKANGNRDAGDDGRYWKDVAE